MSLMKSWIVAFVVTLNLVATGYSQTGIPGPKFSPHDVQEADNTRPLAEPGIFDYDGQMFAPVDFSGSEELRPNSGFYATAERSYYSLSRGGARDVLPLGVLASDVPVGSDYGWGSRFEVGTMSEEGSGWGLVYDQNKSVGFAWGQDYQIGTPFLINTTFTNVEFNRTFRQALSHGGYIDPYFGARFINVSDRTLEDTNGNHRFKQNATNNALGAQVGGRYIINRGRFRYTVDGAIAAAYNSQSYFASDIDFGATTVIAESNFTGNSFVPLVDGRFEVAYMLTRDIGLRLGTQVVHMWDGVARTDNLTTALNPNSTLGFGGGTVGVFNESATAAGFSLGVEWRR